jgi:excisionase family DNA binding protein
MSPFADLPTVLTIEEAAELLRIGRTAAYSAARSGDLPTIKIGRTLRVPKHRLEQLLGLHQDDEGPTEALEVEAPPMQAADDARPA